MEKRKVFGVLGVLVGLSLLALAGQHWRAWQLGQVRGRQLEATERRYARAGHAEQDRAVDAMELTPTQRIGRASAGRTWRACGLAFGKPGSGGEGAGHQVGGTPARFGFGGHSHPWNHVRRVTSSSSFAPLARGSSPWQGLHGHQAQLYPTALHARRDGLEVMNGLGLPLREASRWRPKVLVTTSSRG